MSGFPCCILPFVFPLSCTWRGTGGRSVGWAVGRGVRRRRSKKQKKPSGGPGGRGPRAGQKWARSASFTLACCSPAAGATAKRNHDGAPARLQDGWRVLAVGDMGFGAVAVRNGWSRQPRPGSPRAHAVPDGTQLHLFYFPSRATPHARTTPRGKDRAAVALCDEGDVAEPGKYSGSQPSPNLVS